VPQKYTPREAMSAARRLGWHVEPKKKTGAISYRTPNGQTYTSAAPGRADRVPLLLAKALDEAQAEADA
jgi:hypothetical protein